VCDPSKTPAEDSCVVSDKYGVFASPKGDDTLGDGSMAAPYATLGKAIAEARIGARRVYACADGGTFTEPTLSVDSKLDGAQLYGGFHCADWSYDPSLQTTLDSVNPVAIKVSGLTKGLHIEDFDLRARYATVPGDSSVALWVDSSANVVLQHVILHARQGADGKDGAAFASSAKQGAVGNPGANGACTTVSIPPPNDGGTAVSTQCGSSTSTGGKGGDGPTATVTPGGNGAAGQPALGAGAGGHGQTSASWTCAASGTNGGGRAGGSGGNGGKGPGATGKGSLDATGYHGSAGQSGKPGSIGQGGGGGGGAQDASVCDGYGHGSSGGSGGSGGCGGAGGPGGGGGGSSIALLSVDSTVNLSGCTLQASSGGIGGKGATGQTGGAGGKPGAGGKFEAGKNGTDACAGGDGGNGGNGGAGGGGLGGHSLGVAYVGTKPTLDTATTFQLASSPALGGPGGGGSTSNKGTDGLVMQVLGF
jgi:hypothetical protein